MRKSTIHSISFPKLSEISLTMSPKRSGNARRSKWSRLSEEQKEEVLLVRCLQPYLSLPVGPEREIIQELKREEQLDINKRLQELRKGKPVVKPQGIFSCIAEDEYTIKLLSNVCLALKNVTQSTDCIFYLLNTDFGIMWQYPSSFKSIKDRVALDIGAGTLAEYVISNKKMVITDDVWTDSRFPEGFGRKDCIRYAAMGIPIITRDDEVIAIIQLSKDREDEPYEAEKIFAARHMVAWVTYVLSDLLVDSKLNNEIQMREYLLHIIGSRENIPTEVLVSEILSFAKVCIDAAECCFYLWERDYLYFYEEHLVDGEVYHKKKRKSHNTYNNYVLSKVIQTKGLINENFGIQFNEKNTSFTEAKSILASPIIAASGRIIAVFQFSNKRELSSLFTKNDESVMKSFCGIGYCLMEECCGRDALRRKELNIDNQFELIDFCMENKKIAQSESEPLDEALALQELLRYDWYPKEQEDSFKCSVYILSKWIMNVFPDKSSLSRFIYIVMEGHGSSTSTNFEHALTSVHCLAVFMETYSSHFTSIEIELMMMAAILHSVRHLNIRTKDTEHVLKSDSKSRTIFSRYNQQRFLSSLFTACKIYSNKSKKEQEFLIDQLEILIVNCYGAFKVGERKKILELLESEKFDWKNSFHRDKVKMVILVVADLSYHCKPIKIVQTQLKRFFKEYFHSMTHQGKMKSLYYKRFNKSKEAFIAEYEVEFLRVIYLPWLSLLNCLFPRTQEMYTFVLNAKKIWMDYLAHKDAKLWWPSRPYSED